MTVDLIWRDAGACKGLAPEIFYPDPEDDAEAEIAKEVCQHCMVRGTCLEYALAHREKEGVWGGTTERERRRIIRQRRRTA
jgi:WhiB family redox-sensing transcriptional regulator